MAKRKKQTKVVVVTSGKGGVGKSTVAGNLGAALALLDREVIIADMDIGLRNMDILLGLESRVVFNIIDVAEGSCRLDQALVRSKISPNLRLLPASQTRTKDDLGAKETAVIVERLRDMADYIIIDCPAGIENGFKNSIGSADEAIVVVNPEISSIRDSDRVIGMLDALPTRVPSSLLINRYKESLVRQGDQLSVEDISEILFIPLLGVIPETENVVRGANRGELVPPESPEGRIFRDVARRMEGEAVTVQTTFGSDKEEKKTFLGSLSKLFGNSK